MRCVRNVRQALHRAPASHPAGPKLAAALGSPAAARPRRNLVATAARLTAPWRPPARTCGSSAGSWSACSPGSSGTRRPPPRPRSASRRRCTRPCRAAARAQGCKVRPTHATQQWSAWTSAALTQRFCSPASKLLFELQPCRRAVTHGLTPPRYTWHSGRTLTRGTPKHKQHRVASRARTTWPWRPGHRRRTCPRGSCAKGTTQRARGGAAAGAASAGVQGRARTTWSRSTSRPAWSGSCRAGCYGPPRRSASGCATARRSPVGTPDWPLWHWPLWRYFATPRLTGRHAG